MLVGIHQPHYLPWLRYFEKIARSDVFVVLDNIQFAKNGWQNRNKIKTADAAITWVDSAQKVLRKIRAYNPIPGAFFDLDGARIKCWRAELHKGIEGSAGTILAAGKEGIDVACSDGVVRLLEVQRPGGRRIAAAEFAAQSELQGKQLGYL